MYLIDIKIHFFVILLLVKSELDLYSSPDNHWFVYKKNWDQMSSHVIIYTDIR